MESELVKYYEKTAGRQFNVTVGTTDTFIVGANARRICLIVNPDFQTGIYLSFGAPSQTNFGFHFPAADFPRVLHIREWGDLIRQEIRGIVDGGLAKTVLFGAVVLTDV